MQRNLSHNNATTEYGLDYLTYKKEKSTHLKSSGKKPRKASIHEERSQSPPAVSKVGIKGYPLGSNDLVAMSKD